MTIQRIGHRGMRQGFIVFSLIALAAASAEIARSQEGGLRNLEQHLISTVKRVAPVVVQIEVEKRAEPTPASTPAAVPPRKDASKEISNGGKSELPGQPQSTKPVKTWASGIILTPEGDIVTTHDVVKNAEKILVKLSSDVQERARIVGMDPETNLAVLRVEHAGLPTAEFGNSDDLEVGQFVVAIGNPYGLTRSVAVGIISGLGRENLGLMTFEGLIQTDTAVDPRDTGGALVNIDGEIIGMSTAITGKKGTFTGVSLAIPSNTVKTITAKLMEAGSVRRGLLGVQVQDLTQQMAESFGRGSTAGALVSQVVVGTPAQKAGLKAGDIITKFDGVDLRSKTHLVMLTSQRGPESMVEVEVVRSGKTGVFQIVLGERKSSATAGTTPSAGKEPATESLGISVEKGARITSDDTGGDERTSVKVTGVVTDGFGEKFGIKVGDLILEVNGKPVDGLLSYRRAMREARKTGIVRLRIQRGASTFFVAGRFDE